MAAFINPNFTSPISTFTITFNPNKPTSSSSFIFSSKPSQSHFPSHQLLSYKSIKCSSLSHGRPEYIPNRISDPSYVRIFDTTLRDGEQSPGATMTSTEKLDVARQLAKLGVDIIEAGFPASSKDDLEAVRMIAKEVGNIIDGDGHVPVICGLARCNRTDIDAAWEAVKYAKRPRIHTFIATSEIHLKYKLRKSREEVIAIARDMVSYARSLGCEDVEFSPEDAGRSDRGFLYQILEEVIKAGATTLNIPDTVGYTLPTEFGQLIADIKSNTLGIENVIISTHCQNDLGLSTANTLAGAYAGARQVEVTINGIGERAGNASLEEVVMAIKCRGKELLEGLYTGVNTRHIVMTSKMVINPSHHLHEFYTNGCNLCPSGPRQSPSIARGGTRGPRIELMSHWKAPFGVPAAQLGGVAEYTGLHVQPHKAIVGANAFAHESGIHQDGMLKFKGTYEIISPEDIGLSRSNDSGIVLGKLSGRHALRSRLLELGYELDGKELDDVFWRFKAVAEKKKHLSDGDLEALISDEIFQPQVIWSLGDLQIACGTLGLSTATVKLIGIDGEEHVACSVGTGPVDAAYKAIDLIVKVPVTLLDYSINSVTEGIDAIASNRVVIRGDNGHSITHALTGETIHRTFSGNGAGMDIVVASARAYVSALNKMLGFKSPSASKVSQKSSQTSA